MKRYSGFSLIELMVIITIIGILAAIAVPQYTEYVRRSALVEASSMLADWRVRMEQYYQDNRQYVVGNTTNCGAAAPPTTSVKYFAYSCVGTVDTYTITATGAAGTKGVGFTYTLDEQNVRRTTALPTGFASITLPATCFVTNKGSTTC